MYIKTSYYSLHWTQVKCIAKYVFFWHLAVLAIEMEMMLLYTFHRFLMRVNTCFNVTLMCASEKCCKIFTFILFMLGWGIGKGYNFILFIFLGTNPDSKYIHIHSNYYLPIKIVFISNCFMLIVIKSFGLYQLNTLGAFRSISFL